MKIPTWAKLAIVALGAGVAYRLYKLYQLGERVTYSPRGVGFERDGKNFYIILDLEILNPTNTTVNLKGIDGQISVGDNRVATFAGQVKTIGPGSTQYKTKFLINNAGAATAILTQVALKQWPVFSVSMRTVLPLFSVGDDFDIDTKQYADQILQSIQTLK